MDARYRVVLTGELISGYEQGQAVEALSALLKQPPEKVRLVFNRRATPLNKVLDYKGARDVQQRIESLGVRCKVEVVENRAPASFAARDLTTKPLVEAKKEITCHYCGKVQPQAPACVGCGAYLLPNVTPDNLTLQPLLGTKQNRMLLFIGPRAERYAEKFERYTEGKYALGWNWAAFFGGVMWTAYRKLWLWVGLQLLVTALPFLLPGWGSLGAFALNLAFVASADFIYFHHVQRRLARMEGLPDERVASAGGTSILGALAISFAGGALLMWLGVLQAPFSFAHMQKASHVVLNDRQIAAIADTPEGQRTILAFTETAAAVYAWAARGGDLRTVTVAALTNGGVPSEVLTDGWGTQMMVIPDASGFIVLSPGPDGSFDSDDDIPISFPAQ